jgi:hypothetical protein
MIHQQPKQTVSAILAMLFLTIIVISCNNAADTSKTGADTTKVSAPGDTIKKVDTTKMDTAATRPVKTAN